jgi:hypothetical protein
MSLNTKVRTIFHSINNRMTVIGKLLEVYGKNLPDNKLTVIGNQAYHEAVKELKELRKSLEETAQMKYSAQEWKEKFIFYGPILKEMCPFKIKYHFMPLKTGSVNYHPTTIIENLTFYFEELAMAMATEVEITLSMTDHLFKITLVDDSNGSLNWDNANLIKMKKIWETFQFEVTLRSISSVGSTLEIGLPLTSESYT